MANESEFRTVRGYLLQQQKLSKQLTPSLEDYLEMIARVCLVDGCVRVNSLALQLNVQAPSASRTVKKLADLGYLRYHKYGVVQLTGEGEKLGRYLLQRHETVERFLKNLGVGESLLVDTELIEHHLSQDTVSRLELLNAFFVEHPEILAQLLVYAQRAGDGGE